MRVIVTRAYGNFRVGDEIPDMPPNQARTMIERGYIRDATETKVKPAPADRMVRRAAVTKAAS